MNLKNIVGVAVFILAFFIFRYLGLVGLLFLGAYYFGSWLARLSLRKKWSSMFNKWLSWSNVVFWLLPPLGIFSASFSYELSQKIDKDKRGLFEKLAIAGGAMSAVNALIGVLQKL